MRNILSGRHPRHDERGRAVAGGDPQTLQRSAEEILAGVRRPTAVESAVTGVNSVGSTLQFIPGPQRVHSGMSSVTSPCQGDGYLRQKVPVSSTDYEITVFEHQNAALTLSSLDQVRDTRAEIISQLNIYRLQPAPAHQTYHVLSSSIFSISETRKISSLFNLDCNEK